MDEKMCLSQTSHPEKGLQKLLEKMEDKEYIYLVGVGNNPRCIKKHL